MGQQQQQQRRASLTSSGGGGSSRRGSMSQQGQLPTPSRAPSPLLPGLSRAYAISEAQRIMKTLNRMASDEALGWSQLGVGAHRWGGVEAGGGVVLVGRRRDGGCDGSGSVADEYKGAEAWSLFVGTPSEVMRKGSLGVRFPRGRTPRAASARIRGRESGSWNAESIRN